MKLHVELAKEQTEIAEHVGFGYSIKETADMTGKPIDTVKSTLKAIYKKLDIQKATELAKYVYCRKFNIPLTECEPARRFLAIFLLGLFLTTVFDDTDIYRRVRRTRRSSRIERVNRRQS